MCKQVACLEKLRDFAYVCGSVCAANPTHDIQLIQLAMSKSDESDACNIYNVFEVVVLYYSSIYIIVIIFYHLLLS
jgi:hypothetical protein